MQAWIVILKTTLIWVRKIVFFWEFWLEKLVLTPEKFYV